jgi:hypothetical protein
VYSWSSIASMAFDGNRYTCMVKYPSGVVFLRVHP